MIFVVAEIGVNWDGNFELVKEMMQNAKNAGCNAVKFQAFQDETVKEHPEYLRLMKSSISRTNIDMINSIASSVGIEWFCSPMYVEAIDFLDSYVKRFKIRLFDGKQLFENKESDLVNQVLKTGKQVIISSQISPRTTPYFVNKQISWLYCVPKYPCSLEEINFENIKDFNGYSNHCPNFIAPLTAATLGAEIIEIHITSDKSKNFVDNNVSFDYNELENLVGLIRMMETIEK